MCKYKLAYTHFVQMYIVFCPIFCDTCPLFNNPRLAIFAIILLSTHAESKCIQFRI